MANLFSLASKKLFLKIFPLVLPKCILSIFQCMGGKRQKISLICFLRAKGGTGKNICGCNSLKISHVVS